MDESNQVLRGQAWQEELKGTYLRLPLRAEGKVRKPVWGQSRQSAGLSVAFRSNAPEIKVRYQVEGGYSMQHMPATGVSGVDLYATDTHGRKRWCAARYAFRDTITFTYSDITYATDKGHGYEYELFLPLYNTVKWLEIGVPEGSDFRFLPASQERPIVVYGTSIAQGACASRPGMAWATIVGRKLEHPVVNLGFSGNGQLEPEMFDFLAEIDARLFVIDCMQNMGAEHLLPLIYERVVAGVHKLRQKTTAPILLVEHNGYVNEFTSMKAEEKYRVTNVELRKAYRTLLQEGVTDLHLLTKEEIGFTEDATVEAIHPSDLGMQIYADAYIPRIKSILKEEADQRTVFQPCTQQRDPYDWKQRHEDVLSLNRQQAPEIVLIGNSITHYWGGEPKATIVRGEDSWSSLFKGKVVRNLGFGYDRIENALWRIYHGELDGYDAKKVILLMGTNNLDTNTDDEIVDGINELVRAVRDRQPKAEIYVCGILPRAWKEGRVAQLNQLLQVRLMKEEAVYLDLSAAVTGSDGRIINALFTDGLHPNREGYQRIAAVLQTIVRPE